MEKAPVNLDKKSIHERFCKLIFPLQDAWGIVHGCKDQQLQKDCSTILRECGDFAENFTPNEPFNDRIFEVLKRVNELVKDNLLISDTLRSRVAKAIA